MSIESLDDSLPDKLSVSVGTRSANAFLAGSRVAATAPQPAREAPKRAAGAVHGMRSRAEPKLATTTQTAEGESIR